MNKTYSILRDIRESWNDDERYDSAVVVALDFMSANSLPYNIEMLTILEKKNSDAFDIVSKLIYAVSKNEQNG